MSVPLSQACQALDVLDQAADGSGTGPLPLELKPPCAGGPRRQLAHRGCLRSCEDLPPVGPERFLVDLGESREGVAEPVDHASSAQRSGKTCSIAAMSHWDADRRRQAAVK